MTNSTNHSFQTAADDNGSTADSYNLTPPAYTQSIANDEVSLDVEAVSEGKPRSPADNRLQQQTSYPSSSRHIPQLDPHQEERSVETPQTLSPTPNTFQPITQTGTPVFGHYLTEPVTTADLVGVRACSILQDRPAIWLVRRKKMALSPLAAAVLTKEGLIRVKDLELISQYSAARRDPTDPLSGLMFGVYDVVGEMMLGLVAGPVELGKQATPLLKRSEARSKVEDDGLTQTEKHKGVPHAAAQVALSTGKGLGRIVTASLKSPMTFMNGLTRGFHNLPKSYGDEVREYENVTGLRSGLVVSAKSFGYGVGDGLKDLFVKPVEGAEQNGIVGFGTGVAKGCANVLIKPTAGACGLVGYSSVGLYKSIRNLTVSKGDDPANVVRQLGDAEYQQASDADKLYVVSSSSSDGDRRDQLILLMGQVLNTLEKNAVNRAIATCRAFKKKYSDLTQTARHPEYTGFKTAAWQLHVQDLEGF